MNDHEYNEKVDLLKRKADELGQKAVMDTNLFIKMLDLQAWFPQFGPYNILLLMQKAPHARSVFSMEEVREMGVSVHHEEDWIELLRPQQYPEGVRYEVGRYLDDERLGIAPLPAPDRNRDPQDLSEKIIAACGLATDTAAELPAGVRGVYYDNRRRMLLIGEVPEDPEEMFQRVVTETALFLFSQKETVFERAGLAYAACCCAYLCCRAYGVSTEELGITRIPAGYKKDRQSRALFSLIADAWPKLHAMLQ